MKQGLRSLVMLLAVVVTAGALAGAGVATASPPAASPKHLPWFPVVERDWVPAAAGPHPPANGAMAYDWSHHETVLLVPGSPSETWVFDADSRQWSRKFPPVSPDLVTASAANVGGLGVVVFGTNADAGTCDPAAMGETWMWDGTTWTRLHPSNAPNECAASGFLAMAEYANGSAGAILVITLRGHAGAETWRWNGATWTLRQRSGPTDSPITNFQGRTLSFGGTFSTVHDNDYNATRTLRGSPWATIDSGGRADDPAPRTFASLTADIYDGALLFGGIEHSATHRVLGDTWRRYRGRWVRMGTRHSPPPMAGASFVYDYAHDVSVLFGKGGTWLLTPAQAGGGYLMCASDGGVFTFGDARFFGSTGGMHLNQPIVGIARTPTRKGYWLVARDGGVFTFGDARFYGSTGGIHLTKPIIAIAPSSSGRGYLLVASDGGIFAFGDAPYLGSTGGMNLQEPVVGIAPVLYGRGYLLVTRSGRVFNFGRDALVFPPRNSTMKQPAVGIARTTTPGYWVVNETGGVFTYDTSKFGNNAGVHAPVVAIVASPTMQGYWLFGAHGKAYAFGDAKHFGNAPGNLKAPIVSATAT